MELRDWLTENHVTMTAFGQRVRRAQSIISRVCARRHRPDPTTAVRIVMVTKGAVSLDDLYQTPKKYRADVLAAGKR